jgi:hypothetical protein
MAKALTKTDVKVRCAPDRGRRPPPAPHGGEVQICRSAQWPPRRDFVVESAAGNELLPCRPRCMVVAAAPSRLVQYIPFLSSFSFRFYCPFSPDMYTLWASHARPKDWAMGELMYYQPVCVVERFSDQEIKVSRVEISLRKSFAFPGPLLHVLSLLLYGNRLNT